MFPSLSRCKADNVIVHQGGGKCKTGLGLLRRQAVLCYYKNYCVIPPKDGKELHRHMKISDYFRGWNGPRTVTKTDRTGDGTFQQLFDAAAQEPRDTFTLSSPAPAAEETPIVSKEPTVPPAAQTAGTASTTGIHPKDSINVKLAKLRKLNEEADYTGMSYGEIERAIWKRYDEAFDGNWASIMAFSRIQEKGDIATSDFLREVNRNVSNQLEREFKAETGIDLLTSREKGEWLEFERKREMYGDYIHSKYGNLHTHALGYGNMTTDEIEQAIYKKYEGKHTLRDFLNLQGELFYSGVLHSKLGGDGAVAYIDAMNDQLTKTFFFEEELEGTAMNIPQARWDAALDGKFDAQAFAADMRVTLKVANYSGWEGTLSQGIDYLLISLDQTE